MLSTLSVVDVNYSEPTSLIFEWEEASVYHIDGKSKPMGINVVEQLIVFLYNGYGVPKVSLQK